jgi:HlyD family secretion protein
VQLAKAGGTNKVETAENASPPLTGNEPPEVLMRGVREMRDRGEEPSPEISAKLRELFQSGALQRTGQGGRPAGGGAGSRPRSAPAWRSIYVLATNAPPGSDETVLAPRAVRVKVGITDGSYTEITDGLQEGNSVITAVKLPAAQAATQALAGQSPFGGPGRFR